MVFIFRGIFSPGTRRARFLNLFCPGKEGLLFAMPPISMIPGENFAWFDAVRRPYDTLLFHDFDHPGSSVVSHP